MYIFLGIIGWLVVSFVIWTLMQAAGREAVYRQIMNNVRNDGESVGKR